MATPDTTPADDRLYTLEEYERLPEEEGRVELVRGRLVREPPATFDHGSLTVEIGARIHRYLRENPIGVVVAEVGYVLSRSPPTVRGPDVSFVARERVPPDAETIGFPHMVPDLAVEIVSPSNTAEELQDRVADLLEAGARLVWVIYPSRRQAVAYRSREEARILTEADALDGGEVLPGLVVPLAELFARRF